MNTDNNDYATFYFEDVQRLEILNALEDTYATPHGLAVITGVHGSGVSTLIHRTIQHLKASNAALADLNAPVIDAEKTTVAGMLCDLLAAFGYELPDASHTELLSITQLISQHQAEAGAPPLLVFERADRASPTVLALINALAGTKHKGGSAFRIILTGGEQLRRIVKAEGMSEVGQRISYSASLPPMAINEQRLFIAQALRSRHRIAHENAFDHLIHHSSGLPGSLLSVVDMACESVGDASPISSGDVLLAIESQRRRETTQTAAAAANTPVVEDDISDTLIRQTPVLASEVPEAPQSIKAPLSSNALGEIFVSHDGKLIQRYTVSRRKVLIGRAPHNDIVLDSKWVSRHHAILVCTPEGASLVDINSTNGMTINSREARQGQLADTDVIVIGKFRLKYRNANARRNTAKDPKNLSETRVLRTLERDEAQDMTVQFVDEQSKPADK